MGKNRSIGLAFLGFLASTMLLAQSPAALAKMQQRYTAEQVEEMRVRGHYKYEGLLLFYGSSFLVEEDGQFRSATEPEILGIDLHAHDALRETKEDVVVFDPLLHKQVLLLSRSRFEELVIASLSEADRADYIAYKARATSGLGDKDH